MLCVRCGGDGHLEAPDDGMTHMSYSEFDAGLVCNTCMRKALLRCDSASADSDEEGPQPEPGCADGMVAALELSDMESKLYRANRKLTPRGPVEEPACQALVDVILKGLGLGKRSAGTFYTADVEQLRQAKDALGLALRAVDKLPRDYNTASELSCREVLGTSWTEMAVAVVREYACVCLASGQWSQAAAASRRLLEVDSQRMTLTDLAFGRRLCTPATRAASPFHVILAKCPDFREFRAGWLHQAMRRGSGAADLLIAARARGPLTYAVLTISIKKDVGLWQHAIQSFAPTEDGLRCFGCGAGSSDCVCGEDSVGTSQPTSTPPPLEIEQTVLPTTGSSVQIQGLTSSEGKPLNGCFGTVLALEVNGRLRVRVFGPRATTEKAIKRECTRLTLLSPPLIERQSRGTAHLHSLLWQAPPRPIEVSDSAPSTRAANDSDEQDLLAYVSGYCGRPTPRSNGRGGRTKAAQKSTQEDLA